MNTMTTTTSFDRLTGPDNFRSWKMHIKSTLRSKGLWGFVTGGRTNVREHSSGPHGYSGSLPPQSRPDALDKIILHLENIDDPTEVWKYLESKFQPIGIVKDYTAWIDLITMTFDGKDLRSFCDELTLRNHHCGEQHETSNIEVEYINATEDRRPYRPTSFFVLQSALCILPVSTDHPFPTSPPPSPPPSPSPPPPPSPPTCRTSRLNTYQYCTTLPLTTTAFHPLLCQHYATPNHRFDSPYLMNSKHGLATDRIPHRIIVARLQQQYGIDIAPSTLATKLGVRLWVTQSPRATDDRLAPTRGYEDHGSPGFGGSNDSSLCVLSVCSHCPRLHVHPRDTTQPGTSSPCQERERGRGPEA